MRKGGEWEEGRYREGRRLQGRYPEEDTGQYIVYSAQNNTQRGPCHCDFGITNYKIVNGYINYVLW